MKISFKKSARQDIEQHIKSFRNNEMAVEAFLEIIGPVLESLVEKEVQERLKPHNPDVIKNSARWLFYASSPQTALMLGSRLDPNDPNVSWVKECNKLADEYLTKLVG